jgi:hypothetical protein
MKNIRILTASALTFFASTSAASSVTGPMGGSEIFSASLAKGYESFTFEDDYTVFGGDRFSLQVQEPFNSAKLTISPIGEDGAQDTGVAPIPVPTAVWLFGSGLIGLVAVARRRT